jgi:hypothetical protein
MSWIQQQPALSANKHFFALNVPAARIKDAASSCVLLRKSPWSMRFGAARLAWSAIEQRMYVSQVDPAAAALLQVSLNVLKDPARAVKDFLDA